MPELKRLQDNGYLLLRGKVHRRLYSHPAAYVIRHRKTNLFYVGSTHDLYVRINQHKNHLKNGTHKNPNLQQAYDEEDIFDIMYRKTPCPEAALDLEQELLDYYHPLNMLMNVAFDARRTGLGVPVPEHAKELLRQAAIKQFSTPESKKAHSELIKAKWRDPEYRKKQMERKPTEETLERMSTATTEMWKNPEIVERFLAHRQSQEFRKLISEMKSKPITIDGINYPSLRKAAESLGLKECTLRSYLKRPTRFIKKSDNEYESINIHDKDVGKSITVNGVTFSSRRMAARTLGINERYFYNLTRDKNEITLPNKGNEND